MHNVELGILIGLHRTVNKIDKKTKKLVGDHGLTFSQFMVLEALYSKGDMSVGEVRDRILSSEGTIPLIVNNLVKMNYIERLPCKEDKRVSILHLTDAGYRVIHQIAPKNEKLIVESMDVLDLREKEELLYLLRKLGGKLNGKKS